MMTVTDHINLNYTYMFCLKNKKILNTLNIHIQGSVTIKLTSQTDLWSDACPGSVTCDF